MTPRPFGAPAKQRPSARHGHPAVLLISGDAEGVDPELKRLTKPFRQADLGAVIAELLQQAARPRP